MTNSNVYVRQDLRRFHYFLVVSCEEFAVAVKPFLSSYHLLFPFQARRSRGGLNFKPKKIKTVFRVDPRLAFFFISRREC